MNLSELWERGDIHAISKYELDESMCAVGKCHVDYKGCTSRETNARLLLTAGLKLPELITQTMWVTVSRGMRASIGQSIIIPTDAVAYIKVKRIKGKAPNLEPIYHWLTREAGDNMGEPNEGE